VESFLKEHINSFKVGDVIIPVSGINLEQIYEIIDIKLFNIYVKHCLSDKDSRKVIEKPFLKGFKKIELTDLLNLRLKIDRLIKNTIND
jgi:hypothetical protein